MEMTHSNPEDDKETLPHADVDSVTEGLFLYIY